jgi:hypothetical protein
MTDAKPEVGARHQRPDEGPDVGIVTPAEFLALAGVGGMCDRGNPWRKTRRFAGLTPARKRQISTETKHAIQYPRRYEDDGLLEGTLTIERTG